MEAIETLERNPMKINRTVVMTLIVASAFTTVASADSRMFHSTNRNEAIACKKALDYAAQWLSRNYVALTASHASTETSKCDCVGDSQQGYTCAVEVRITAR